MSESASSQRPQTLTGRLAIVTGATRGIGHCIARDLLSRGASVLGTYRSASSTSIATSLTSEASSLSPAAKFQGVRADILDIQNSPEAIVNAVRTHFPSQEVDILVINAAVATLGPLESLDVVKYQEAITGNQLFPALLVQKLLPLFSKNGKGRIIAISSESASLSRPNTTVYSATKAAMESMVRTWSKELGQKYGGMTVNAVAPGLTKTELWGGLPEERKKVGETKAKEGSVTGELGREDDVAGVVGWLAGDESRWVTGTTVAVNGGMFDI